MKRVFNKLVRDKIPEKIEENGEYALIRTLDDEGFMKALNEKLIEEAGEVINAETKDDITEELADLMEVMLAKALLYGVSLEEILKVKKEKKNKKGGFDKRIFLINTADKRYVEEHKGCLLCVNECCKVPYEEKTGYEDDGKPVGYYCVGYKSCYTKQKNRFNPY